MATANLRCGRPRNSDGLPCTQWRIKGGTVCKTHGGSAPQVKRAAALRVVEEQAAKAVGKFKIVPLTNPLQAAAELGGELVAVKNWLRGLVEQIEDSKMRIEGFGPVPEQMRAELTAYMGMLTQTTSLIVQIGKLNIDERMARIEEQQKMMIIRALQSGLAEAGITGPQAQKALAGTGRHLKVAA